MRVIVEIAHPDQAAKQRGRARLRISERVGNLHHGRLALQIIEIFKDFQYPAGRFHGLLLDWGFRDNSLAQRIWSTSSHDSLSQVSDIVRHDAPSQLCCPW